jgi:hypothetical protein
LRGLGGGKPRPYILAFGRQEKTVLFRYVVMNKQEFLDRVNAIKAKMAHFEASIEKTIDKADKLAETLEEWKAEFQKKTDAKK